MATFILLTPEQADTVRGEASPTFYLDPIKVDLGDYAGQYVLPPEVLNDAGYATWHSYLEALPLIEGDPDEMWEPVY